MRACRKRSLRERGSGERRTSGLSAPTGDSFILRQCQTTTTAPTALQRQPAPTELAAIVWRRALVLASNYSLNAYNQCQLTPSSDAGGVRRTRGIIDNSTRGNTAATNRARLSSRLPVSQSVSQSCATDGRNMRNMVSSAVGVG